MGELGAAVRRVRLARPDALIGGSVPAWLTLAVLLVWAGISIPGFLLPDRLLALGQQVTPLLLVALGQTIVLLIGGLDLSVGSVLTLSLVLGSGVMQGRAEWVLPGVALCLLAGGAVGLVNGLLVVVLRLPPLIATIATMTLVQGLAWVYTHGAPYGSMPGVINAIANARWGIFPVADVLSAAVIVIVALLLHRTVFGRQLYAVGANARAARLAGVPVNRITVLAFVLSAVLAAAGGLVLGGYIGVGTLEAGPPYVLNSIAVVIIGGTKFSGGEGGIAGTVVGVGIVAILAAILIQLGVPIALRSVLLGLIVLVAAALQANRIGRRRLPARGVEDASVSVSSEEAVMQKQEG